MAQARTAWTCAEQADHTDLRAWVLGTQALIAEWTGRPAKAVDIAQRGQQFATSADSQVRLAAIEARAQARARNAPAAIQAVTTAQRARERETRTDTLAEYGGILTFPEAKQLYYAGSTLALAGEPEAAEQTAMQAIRMYERGPVEQRSYGDEALARIDVASARASMGDLDGVRGALAPVLSLPPDQRIKQVGAGLDRVKPALNAPEFTNAPLAQSIREDIDHFAVPADQKHLLGSEA